MGMRWAAAVLAITSAAMAANWPSWRGPSGFGTSSDQAAPTEWSSEQNVRWRVDLPEPGNSTPVVWEDKVFLTQPLMAQKKVALMCFDRSSGELLWQAAVANENPGPSHDVNPQASSSPVTDGQIVAVWYGSAGLYAYDLNGNQLWRRDLGPQAHTWGYASSPVIHGNRLFLNFGPGERSFLVALDKRSGGELWRASVPTGTGEAFAEWSPEDMYGSWATPVIARTTGGDELILSWPRMVVSFDPATGDRLWTCDGLGNLIYPSPVYGEGVIVAMAGFGGASLAVRAGGSGNVTETHRLWRKERSGSLIGSGVIRDRHFYTVDNGGIAECINLSTGESVWRERLATSGAGSLGVWSSPVLNGDNIYVMNQSAQVLVFKASPTYELLASNELGEESNSSVVISDGDIFLRTFTGLWAISADK